MATRDMFETVATYGEPVPSEYDMSVYECVRLSKMSQDAPIEAVHIAFKYGFILGSRYMRKRGAKNDTL